MTTHGFKDCNGFTTNLNTFLVDSRSLRRFALTLPTSGEIPLHRRLARLRATYLRLADQLEQLEKDAWPKVAKGRYRYHIEQYGENGDVVLVR